MLVAGTFVLVMGWAPVPVKRALVGVTAALLIAVVLAWRARRKRRSLLSPILGWLDARGRHASARRAVADGIRRTGEILGTLVFRQPWTFISTSLLELAFQALSVLEVWVTLVLLGVDASFLAAFLMDYVNRMVTVAFRFVPLRLGVDEWASAAMATVLGSGGAAGVTVAVIRKARVLCWSTAGLAIGAWRMTTNAAPRRTVPIPVEPAGGAAS